MYQEADKGVEVDIDKAIKWLSLAAQNGQPEAQLDLAKYYIEQFDYERATGILKKSASQGNSKAQYLLGRCYETGLGGDCDKKEAFYWMKKAADHGDIKALYSSGKMLLSCESKRNESNAFKMLLQAAKQGHIKAKYEVGKMYNEGVGTNKNVSLAYKWLGEALAEGDTEAIQYANHEFLRLW